MSISSKLCRARGAREAASVAPFSEMVGEYRTCTSPSDVLARIWLIRDGHAIRMTDPCETSVMLRLATCSAFDVYGQYRTHQSP